jgi:hypothetical protein
MSINNEDDAKKIIGELAAAWKQSSSNINQYFDALKKEKEKTPVINAAADTEITFEPKPEPEQEHKPEPKQQPKSQPKPQPQLTCSKCGKPYREGSKFCGSCGNKIEFKNICAFCGADLKPSAKFCSSCGKKTL